MVRRCDPRASGHGAASLSGAARTRGPETNELSRGAHEWSELALKYGDVCGERLGGSA